MAFWNAPLDDPKHAEDGCRSALAMVQAMAPLNARLEQEAKEEGRKHLDLKVGLGLNSGDAVVGNMGTAQRMDYSVLGDTVNTAARLEGQSKTYGVEILMSEATRAPVRDLAFLELDLVQVVGKSEPVRIFTLVGDQSLARSEVFLEAESVQKHMLECYRTRRWQEALELIGQLEQLDLQRFKGYLSMMRQRIEAFNNAPPGEDWGGVERRLVK